MESEVFGVAVTNELVAPRDSGRQSRNERSRSHVLLAELSAFERSELHRRASAVDIDPSISTRSRIVLAAAGGLSDTEIASVLSVDRSTVRRWTERFLAQGLAGLDDRARSGAPRSVSDATVVSVLAAALVPSGEGRVSTRAVAARLGVSPSTVSRLWRTYSINSHPVVFTSADDVDTRGLVVDDILGIHLDLPQVALSVVTRDSKRSDSITGCIDHPSSMLDILEEFGSFLRPIAVEAATEARSTLDDFVDDHTAGEGPHVLVTSTTGLAGELQAALGRVGSSAHVLVTGAPTGWHTVIQRWLLAGGNEPSAHTVTDLGASLRKWRQAGSGPFVWHSPRSIIRHLNVWWLESVAGVPEAIDLGLLATVAAAA